MLDAMSLNEVMAGFPELAPAVDCIRPFIGLFDSREVAVDRERRRFQVTSYIPLPWLNPDIKRWWAHLNAERVRVIAFKGTDTPNTFESVWSNGFALDEFADFLRKVSDHQKKAGRSRRAL
jgi:hypothetical protein